MFWYSGINSQFEPFIFQFSIHFVSSVYNGACLQHWLNRKADKLQSLPGNLFNVLKETAAWQEWLPTGAQPSVTRSTPNEPVYFLGTTTTKVLAVSRVCSVVPWLSPAFSQSWSSPHRRLLGTWHWRQFPLSGRQAHLPPEERMEILMSLLFSPIPSTNSIKASTFKVTGTLKLLAY